MRKLLILLLLAILISPVIGYQTHVYTNGAFKSLDAYEEEDGDIAVCYWDSVGTAIHYAHYTYSNNTWDQTDTEVNGDAFASDNAGDCSIYPGSDGIHIAFKDINGDLKHCLSGDSGASWSCSVLEAGTVGYNIDMKVSGTTVYIAFPDTALTDLRYGYGNNAGWTVEEVDPDSCSYPSIYLTGPHIACYDSNAGVGNLILWDKTTGSWVEETVKSVSDVGLYLNMRSPTAIVYYDQTNTTTYLATYSGAAWSYQPIAPSAQLYAVNALQWYGEYYVLAHSTISFTSEIISGSGINWNTESTDLPGLNTASNVLLKSDYGTRILYSNITDTDLWFYYDTEPAVIDSTTLIFQGIDQNTGAILDNITWNIHDHTTDVWYNETMGNGIFSKSLEFSFDHCVSYNATRINYSSVYYPNNGIDECFTVDNSFSDPYYFNAWIYPIGSIEDAYVDLNFHTYWVAVGMPAGADMAGVAVTLKYTNGTVIGTKTTGETGWATFNVTNSSTYNYFAARDNFRPYSGTVTVDNNDTIVHIPMIPLSELQTPTPTVPVPGYTVPQNMTGIDWQKNTKARETVQWGIIGLIYQNGMSIAGLFMLWVILSILGGMLSSFDGMGKRRRKW